MYERRGWIYRMWAIAWPTLSCLIRARPGRFAQHPPLGAVRAIREGRARHQGAEAARELARYRWWKLWIYSSVRHVLSAGRGGISTVTIGIVSLYPPSAALIIGYVTDPLLMAASLMLLSALFVYAIIVTSGYMGYLAIRAMSPEDYARTVLYGASVSETFRIVSYEMLVACRWFEQDARVLTDFLSKRVFSNLEAGGIYHISQIRDAFREEHVALRHALDRFRLELVSHRVEFQRLVHLKSTAADSLGIPRRRLCDNLFEYSPALQEYMSFKFADDFESLLDGFSVGTIDAGLKARLTRTADKTKHVVTAVQGCIGSLEAMFAADPEVHNRIHRFASQHSSSGSVIEYARTLVYIAERGKEALQGFAGREDDEQYRLLNAELRFLYRKQKAYPGFDIHESTLNLCRLARTSSPTTKRLGPEVVKLQYDLLQRMASERSGFKLATGVLTSQDRRARVFLELEGLRALGVTVESYGAECRHKLCNEFETLMRAEAVRTFTGQPPGELAIISHGYSKTVRDAIRRIDFPAWGHGEKTLRVFLLSNRSAAGDLPAEDFDAQRMRHEILDGGGPTNVKCAVASDYLFDRIYASSDTVLIVLGAEAFDRHRRVLHPNGASDRIQQLRRKLAKEQIRCFVIVLAERYKRHDEMLTQDELFNAHLDRVEVYPPELVDLVLTDERSQSLQRV